MLGVFVFVASWRIVVFRRLVSRAGMLCPSRMRRTLWLNVSEIKGRLSVSGVGRLFCKQSLLASHLLCANPRLLRSVLSSDNTLYRQNALPKTRSPTDSTLSRTRQQHLHPSHNLQSPLSYVHSYPRKTGFLSLYYTYFAP